MSTGATFQVDVENIVTGWFGDGVLETELNGEVDWKGFFPVGTSTKKALSIPNMASDGLPVAGALYRIGYPQKPEFTLGRKTKAIKPFISLWLVLQPEPAENVWTTALSLTSIIKARVDVIEGSSGCVDTHGVLDVSSKSKEGWPEFVFRMPFWF